MRKASLVSADWSWEPGFTEMSASELILRKLLSVSDLTVCLDRRTALGKIEIYEANSFLSNQLSESELLVGNMCLN